MTHALLTRALRQDPVVITGIGAWSAGGPSVEALWDAAAGGRGTARWRDFPTEAGPRRYPISAAPETVPAPPALRVFRKMDRCVQMAAFAASEAWDRAGLAAVGSFERIGVVVGSSRGPVGKCSEAFLAGPSQRVPPSLAADGTFASVSGSLAQFFRLKGPGAMISATCASSAFAMAYAAEQIVLGRADAMLVGGTEAAISAPLLLQLESAGVLGSHESPDQTCRPFDLARNGLALGEGSGFLVLESAQHAARRGASVLARLAGWAAATDDCGRAGVNAEGTGLVQVMRSALDLAGLPPGRIDYLNAHGTGTRMNDAAEARAVVTVFGARAATLPCTSTKPITGHCLGATPALEAVLCVEVLNRQRVLPTANCSTPDPECPIHMRPDPAQPVKLESVMSNSVGFWGYHASLIFSRT